MSKVVTLSCLKANDKIYTYSIWIQVQFSPQIFDSGSVLVPSPKSSGVVEEKQGMHRVRSQCEKFYQLLPVAHKNRSTLSPGLTLVLAMFSVINNEFIVLRIQNQMPSTEADLMARLSFYS